MKIKPFIEQRWRLMVLTCLLVVMVFTTSGAWAQPKGQFSPDMLAIQGRWVRMDAPYVIELSHAEDGSLQADYYNPRPIHVSRAASVEHDGQLQVMVELRDVNYPGSTYFLAYDQGHDRMSGYYFHPVSQQTFEVEFVRQTAR